MRLSEAPPLRLVGPPNAMAVREAQCALEAHVFRGNNLAKLLAIASTLAQPDGGAADATPEADVLDRKSACDLIDLLAKIARTRFASDDDGVVDCMRRLDEFLSFARALRDAAVGGHA